VGRTGRDRRVRFDFHPALNRLAFGVGRYLIRGARGAPALYHAGCAAADAAPALSVRGRLPRAGKRAPLILSLRSGPRRVRDAARRQMCCARCAWGCQDGTDRWARTRRVESLCPFSRAREQTGAARGSLQTSSAGQGRHCVTGSPAKRSSTEERRSQTGDSAAHVQRRAWLRPPTAVGARRRTAKPERDRSRFRAATSHRAIRAVRIPPPHRALRHMSS